MLFGFITLNKKAIKRSLINQFYSSNVSYEQKKKKLFYPNQTVLKY